MFPLNQTSYTEKDLENLCYIKYNRTPFEPSAKYIYNNYDAYLNFANNLFKYILEFILLLLADQLNVKLSKFIKFNNNILNN